jgi:hypothetical protein
MTRYLISFDQGAMDHIPDEEGPAVGEAGTVTDAPKSKPHIGGGMIVDVPSREDAIEPPPARVFSKQGRSRMRWLARRNRD